MDESSRRPRQVDGDGVAKRRRLRRLRSWWRHEQQTVAAVLATFQHHSAPRGPRTARTGERSARRTTRPRSGRCSPQGRILRHVVGHLPAPALDVPVPQMVDQLPDIEQFFRALSPDPEQVIEVPKILPLDVPMRAALRVTQLVEQLVEVPTITSFSSLQRTVEQHVDIPVPDGGGSFSGLQGFLPRQRSTASLSRKRISERTVEQIVDPVSRGSLPGSSSSHSPAGDEECADEPGQGVFRTFPKFLKKKSAKVAPHSGSELPPHSSSWTAAAQLEDSVEWVRLREKHAGKAYFFWNRRTDNTVWRAPAGVEVVWYGEKDEKGGVWYWHRDTRVSTFELPPLPPE